MNRVSKKRMKLVRERRKVLARMPDRCAAGLECCTGRAVDGHEILSRARGGSIVDPANILPVCRLCHDWITEHPKDATERGLLRARWPK